MTRTSILCGAVLGMLLILDGLLRAHAGAMSVFPFVVGGLVLGAASWSARAGTGSRILMSAAACVALVRYLPLYFQTYRAWPGLPIILLATCTMGFGVLSVLLDKYRPGAHSGPPGHS